MVVVSIPVKVSTSQRGIRPVDPARDLPEVVELIALGFEEELGPRGQKMLREMRRAARPAPYIRLLYATNAGLPGYVWEDGGQIVANLSLRRASASRGRGWIIGNVVVHPDFRGQGIGRALMEHAMESARLRDGRWIGLEVRANNEIARTLYSHLGFHDVGRTAHMIHSPAADWPAFAAPEAEQWRKAKSEDRQRWARLAASIYGRLQLKVMEIYPGRYEFSGLDRTVLLWLRGIREKAWLQATDRPRRAVRARTERRHHFHHWDLLIHPDQTMEQARAAVTLAMTTLGNHPRWPVVTTVDVNAPVVPVLEGCGFRHHRTLVQMYCEISS